MPIKDRGLGSDTLARIIDSHWNSLQRDCNGYELRILHAIRRCRTPSLGGHQYECDRCKKKHFRYNSCRNRHCPQCQNTDKERWVMARSEQLIQVPYYHIVFTLPHTLNELCLRYRQQIYSMMFRISWQTLDEFGWNKKYLGAQIGVTMVLHSWGSNMSFHPHIHCIVPGGGVSLSGKWKAAKGKGKFLFPVKAMSKVYRVKSVEYLKKFLVGKEVDNTESLCKQLYAKPWVVYAKPPFGGPQAVIKYLARYTHKTAITHHRIKSWNKEEVTIRYTDYRHANQKKEMTLSTQEFLRRYKQHFLPKGFPRVRHYGILSSAWKKRIFPNAKTKKTDWQSLWVAKGVIIDQCPYCKIGKLIYVKEIKPVRGPPPAYNNRHTKTQKDETLHS